MERKTTALVAGGGIVGGFVLLALLAGRRRSALHLAPRPAAQGGAQEAEAPASQISPENKARLADLAARFGVDLSRPATPATIAELQAIAAKQAR